MTKKEMQKIENEQLVKQYHEREKYCSDYIDEEEDE